MMEQREKLIKLLKEALENHVCGDCESFTECGECVAQCEADYLLANGVVVPARCEDCDGRIEDIFAWSAAGGGGATTAHQSTQGGP